MGVPKFYRWISERYPCLSEVIKEYQIPDFDNLYLDMNGIIHTCSHPNDDDPHFRITEEKIFAGICYYIDFLFKMIKPRKVFFMAIDGVAPRAKMNQQRGRRFRTAKTAVLLEEKAKSCGEDLPTEARFDSNCITPGTVFMARLHEKLKNFVVYKLSTDKLWQGVRVYLSGHETPGEGEHKIMDFIRYEKSQSNYDPNTRHCLYGLDADLMMLGLCSHELHFSLLREEVKFGGKRNQKRILTPEETTFHLLHISLLREYLGYEFDSVKSKISFEFDLEHIVDDFVLMSFLVGNDFIPHLPQLHIHHDALPVLFQMYIDVLPTLNGYINEHGCLHLERFETFFKKLAEYDFQKFGEMNDDFQYLENKSKLKKNHEESEHDKISTTNILSNLGFSNLAISKTAEFDSSTDEDEAEEEDEEESEEEESTLELEFNMHKVDYYLNKLEYESVTPEVMREQAEGYVRAIQWNLHYYYNGVVSWSWYYPHHYSPYISDIKDFKNMEMKFELGKPFLPFQQLLAVLPKLSKDLLPTPYQMLMCDKDSPLIDYYPDDFGTDLNGKQQEWEAVVLIPFINEKLLLKFAAEADKDLTEEEGDRNKHGPHLLYTFTEKLSGPLPSFLPGYFPTIEVSHAKLTEIPLDFFRLPPNSIIKGLCEGVILDKFFMGFPTLKTIKHTARLSNEKVKVFQMVSQKENMMISIKEPTNKDLKKVAEEIVGKIIYVGWPHLRQACVVAVSDEKTRYSVENSTNTDCIKLVEETMEHNEQNIWSRQVESVEEHCYQRWGIFVGKVPILVHVKCFTGSRYVVCKDGDIDEEKQWEKTISNYALQTTLQNIHVYSPEIKRNKSMKDLFTPGLVVFPLGQTYYGCMGIIIDNDLEKHKDHVLVRLEIPTEPDIQDVIKNQHKFISQEFMPGYIAAQRLGIKPHFISRLTGTFLIQNSPKNSLSPNRINIGLNLKFNKKNEEVCGFSKKNKDNQWLYSEEAIKTMNQYLLEFADFFEKLIPFINEDIVYLEDIYPDGSGNEIVNKISNWLKAQSCSSAERQKCGMEKLDAGIISAVEQKVDETIKQDKVCLKAEISPQELYSPFLCKGVSVPDPSTTFRLFDRVINVWHSSSVPLGLRGTIIGVKSAEKECDYVYEVVFDKEFFGGLSIACSPGKGYRMPPSALINISHGERQKIEIDSSKWRAKKDAPKLNRNPIFSSAIRSLQRVNTVENSPPQLQVLRKNSDLPMAHHGKPFYKADVGTFQNLPMEPLVTPQCFTSNIINDSKKQFVTPKASRLSSGANYNSNSTPVPKRNISNNIQSPDYHNIWADLKKTPSAESSPTNTPLKQSYGRQLSVKELFEGAELQNQQLQSNAKRTPILPQPPIGMPQPSVVPLPQSAVVPLMNHCINYHHRPPLYSYAKYGTIGWSIATISLPDGKSFSSDPCPTDKDATENAAEKGLAYIRSKEAQQSFVRDQTYVSNIVPQNQAVPQRPLMQPNFPVDCIPSFFQNPGCLPHPPIVHPPFSVYEAPLMRNPYPTQSAHIPDSFVKHNQQLLLNNEASFFPKYQTEYCRKPSDSRVLLPETDVYHLPGPYGGTASVRNVSPRRAERQHSNMFVPAQVMKNVVKTPEDNPSDLSSSEWPSLPFAKNDVPQALPAGSAWQTNTNSLKSNETSFYSAKAKSTSQNIPVTVKPVPSQTTPTVLKPKKKRIAANFSNT